MYFVSVNKYCLLWKVATPRLFGTPYSILTFVESTKLTRLLVPVYTDVLEYSKVGCKHVKEFQYSQGRFTINHSQDHVSFTQNCLFSYQ